jgi:hypothetical protein
MHRCFRSAEVDAVIQPLARNRARGLLQKLVGAGISLCPRDELRLRLSQMPLPKLVNTPLRSTCTD